MLWRLIEVLKEDGTCVHLYTDIYIYIYDIYISSHEYSYVCVCIVCLLCVCVLNGLIAFISCIFFIVCVFVFRIGFSKELLADLTESVHTQMHPQTNRQTHTYIYSLHIYKHAYEFTLYIGS